MRFNPVKFILTLILLVMIGCFFYGVKVFRRSFVVKHNGKIITDADRIAIYAHRGGRGLVPENTLWAYQFALTLGVDYVDMDVNMTQDGVLIVYHDSTLNSNITQDESGQFVTQAVPLRELTYGQIKRYHVGKLNPASTYRQFFPLQYQVPDARIPTLAEVIDFVKDNAGDKIGFQIELKADPDDANQHPEFYRQFVSSFYRLLKEKHIINRTEVQSGTWSLLIDLQSYDRHIKTAYLTGDKTFKDEMVKCYGKKLNTSSIFKIIRAYGGTVWGPLETELMLKDVQEAHRYGLKVVPWSNIEIERTAFDAQRVSNLIQWKVDGIITDRPDILRGLLAAKNDEVPPSIPIKKHAMIIKSLETSKSE
jgi:glycerophosphoryl diester phosphodiesterase